MQLVAQYRHRLVERDVSLAADTTQTHDRMHYRVTDQLQQHVLWTLRYYLHVKFRSPRGKLSTEKKPLMFIDDAVVHCLIKRPTFGVL